MASRSSIDKFLENVPIADLIARVRRAQVWPRDGRMLDSHFDSHESVPLTYRWIQDSQIKPGNMPVKATVLFRQFAKWTREKNITGPSITALGRALRDRLPKKRTKNGITYLISEESGPLFGTPPRKR